MIGEITPLVKWDLPERWLRVAGLHMLGAAVSAALFGGAVGFAGDVIESTISYPESAAAALPAGLFVAGILLEANSITLRWPSLNRQTPRWFKNQFSSGTSALLWGLDLGQGWTTHVVVPGYYPLVAWVLLLGDSASGMAIMGLYGLGRSLPVVVTGLMERLRNIDHSTVVSTVGGQFSVTAATLFLMSMVSSFLIATVV